MEFQGPGLLHLLHRSNPLSTCAQHCLAAENLDPSADFPGTEGTLTGQDLPYQR